MHGVAAFLGVHVGHGVLVHAARGIGIAGKLDVAAERQRRDLPTRAAPVDARPQHRPETQ